MRPSHLLMYGQDVSQTSRDCTTGVQHRRFPQRIGIMAEVTLQSAGQQEISLRDINTIESAMTIAIETIFLS